MTEEAAKALLLKYNEGHCSPEEEAVIRTWLDDIGKGKRVFLNEDHRNAYLKRVDEKVEEGLGMQLVSMEGSTRLKNRSGFRKRLTIAAFVLLTLGMSAYEWVHYGKNNAQQAVVRTVDIAPPSGTHAVITLANGQHIYLDSTSSGILAAQGNSNLVKLSNGDIAYKQATDAGTNKIMVNTLSVPKGSLPVHITLSDGSQVWLNAASSLSYPAVFTGKERAVTISGEGYFEVAHNPAMPFIITKGDETVKVLGTHFDIAAYDDERQFNVTLLQGSVEVGKSDVHEVIIPGQQASIIGSNIHINNNVDVESIMAWKDGRFAFGGQDIDEIMRQISRWYNVEIVYQGKPSAVHFMGNLTRLQNVSQVLNVLEQTNSIHFRIETNKITVLQ
ncbi:MAG: FecR domain-containing protein [Arachidicoccus sp.]|nr:FecR domain-containing protein [Arachidicoccus sp.]